MTGEARPRYSALQLFGKCDAYGRNRVWYHYQVNTKPCIYVWVIYVFADRPYDGQTWVLYAHNTSQWLCTRFAMYCVCCRLALVNCVHILRAYLSTRLFHCQLGKPENIICIQQELLCNEKKTKQQMHVHVSWNILLVYKPDLAHLAQIRQRLSQMHIEWPICIQFTHGSI